MNSSSFTAAGSKRCEGMTLPGNGDAVRVAPEPDLVAGSKFCGRPAKLPARIAREGTLSTLCVCLRLRSDSKFDVKNSLFLPLNSFGIRIGPPRVKPYWLKRNGSLGGTTLVNASFLAFNAEFRKNSKAVPW